MKRLLTVVWICTLLVILSLQAFAQPQLREGWPVDIGQPNTSSFFEPNPLALHIMPDGSKRIVTAIMTGITIYDIDGNVLENWSTSGYVAGANYVCAGPCVGDVTGDGEAEIVVATRAPAGRDRGIIVFDFEGNALEGLTFAHDLDYVDISTFTLADLDGDDDLEIVYSSNLGITAVQGNGATVEGFPWALDQDPHWIAGPTVINGPNYETPIIVYCTQDYQVHAREITADAELAGFPVAFTSDSFNSPPVVIPQDDGWVVAISNASHVYAWDQTGTALNGFPVTPSGLAGQQVTSLSAGDIDGDEVPELLFRSGGVGSIHAIGLNGAYKDGFPQTLTDNGMRETVSVIKSGPTSDGISFFGCMTTTAGLTELHAFLNDEELAGFPVNVNTIETVPRTYTGYFPPENGTLQLVVHTLLGYTAVYEMEFEGEDPVLEWAMPHGHADGNLLYRPVQNEVQLAPAITFNPADLLDFGETFVPEPITVQLVASNIGGTAEAVIDSILVPEAFAGEIVVDAEFPVMIEIDGDYTFDITWTPTEFCDLSGSIQIYHNDASLGSPTEIAISGSYLDGLADDNQLPDSYFLAQNYPNPFNPETTIRFGLKTPGYTELTIYSVEGRRVASLVNGTMQSGTHEVKFNASNLASGVYYYQLKSGSFEQINKMILLR